MDRFKSPRIQSDRDLLKVMLYIDLNPKRAHKVAHPKDNEYSSYAHYAHGREDPLLTPAPSYLALATTPERRQRVYQALVEEILKNDWKEKRPYSSVYFIGNPSWVLRKNRQIRALRKEQFADWKERYAARFG